MSHLFVGLTDWLASWGYWGIFGTMTLESMLVPIPSELVIPFGGYLASRGELALVPVILVSALANLTGSVIAYGIGRRWGHGWAVSLPFVRRKEVEHAEAWLRHYGLWASFLSRLIPGVRTVISLPLGTAGVPFASFAALTFAGSLLWCALLAYIGYQLGERWREIETLFGPIQVVIAATLLGLVGWWLWRRRSNKR